MADNRPVSRNSEFDFAVIPEEGNEEGEEMVEFRHLEGIERNEDRAPVELFSPFLDFNVLMVLTNYGVSDAVIEGFTKHQITFAQLRNLEDEDLLELGVVDDDLRQMMAEDFHSFYHIDRRRPAGMWPRRQLSVIDFIHQQLTRINTLVAAAMLNIGAYPRIVHSPGVILNNSHQQFFSPPAVIHLMGLLSDHITDMQVIVSSLRNTDELNRLAVNIERNRMKKNAFKFGIGLFVFCAGMIAHKIARGK